MKAINTDTPRTHNIKETVLRRRKIINETSLQRSRVTPQQPKVTQRLTRSPVTAHASRYFLRSSLNLCSPSPQPKTRHSLGRSVLKSCKTALLRTPKLTSKINNFALQENKAMKPIWKQDIKGLLNVSWKVCYLSSMTNFQYRIKNVRNICEAVLQTKILAVGAFLNLSVKIELSSCLTQKPSVANAVIVRVTASSLADEEGEETIMNVYTTWLVASSKCQSRRSSRVEWLPLMLYNGRESIHAVVIEWLQSSFGCFVTPKMLQQSTMLWISAVWSKERCTYKRHNESDGKIFYKYNVRKFLNIGQDVEISMTFLRDDIRKMYQFIEGKYETDTIPFVSEFHSTIQSFVSSATCIPSDLLRLHKLRTSCFSLDNNGFLKLLCPTKIPSLLNHLTELLQQMLNCNHLPGLSSNFLSTGEETDERDNE